MRHGPLEHVSGEPYAPRPESDTEAGKRNRCGAKQAPLSVLEHAVKGNPIDRQSANDERRGKCKAENPFESTFSPRMGGPHMGPRMGRRLNI